MAVEKVAVTPLAAFITAEQEVPVPLHAPLQPEKVEPEAGVAESVTLVPLAKGALQVSPQLIPLGNEVTMPLPLPGSLMVSENVELGTEVVDEVVVTYVVDVVGGIDVVEVVLTILVLKLAVIVVFVFIVVVHSPVPLHPPPDQPSKVDPGSAVAERGTTMPGL
jgi:hypothetical protein